MTAASAEDRIAELEARLEESEETLSAMRRGDFDAVVVEGTEGERYIYTLESADRPYRVLIEQIQEGALTVGEDGTVLYCNQRLAEMLGRAQEQVIGQSLVSLFIAEDAPSIAELLDTARTAPARAELRLTTVDGMHMPTQVALSPLDRDGGAPLFCGVLTDLTVQRRHLRELADANERLEAEASERQRVEEALRQSQKMEAVGQLTGGLAHDFNNLLAGISGSLDMMQTRIQQGRIADIERYMVGAQGAAKRAAALTHRLLAFSRRQTLEPKPTDVNRLVSGMEDMIQRTVGPQITVETVGKGGLWSTLVDPNQLENALLNLCINARDAMPDGGKITIETANRWLDDRGGTERDLPAGQYLSMCVSDNGTGMPPDVIEKAFDPFFTTKPIGIGTGLGLSMIYGFARQSGGQVRIYSEVGEGTMVCLYLPRHHGDVPAEPTAIVEEVTETSNKRTVLVIDDEPLVRMLMVDAVEDLGHIAIEAGDGPQGLKVLRSDTAIDLLITDVGLPNGMNGRQVADAARELRPNLTVMFVTGYAENAVLSHGHLDPGMHIVTKPFDMAALSKRIQGLIDG